MSTERLLVTAQKPSFPRWIVRAVRGRGRRDLAPRPDQRMPLLPPHRLGTDVGPGPAQKASSLF